MIDWRRAAEWGLGAARVAARRCWRRALLLGPDLVYVTTLVALSYALFLRKWQLWEDQSIYHYMAWGARHGLILYRDVINMNWPGCVLVHMLAQSLMGMDAAGVRLVEAVALWILGLSTSSILRAYRIGLPFRMAATTIFLVAYFDAGDWQTAQRESFMTACLGAALVPILTAHLDGERRGLGAWAVAGAFAAFGMSVKPTMGLPLAGAALVAVLLHARGMSSGAGRHHAFRALRARFVAFGAGGAAVLAALLAFLAVYGDLRGFWRWGVEFTFGPYSRLRYADAVQEGHLMDILNRPAMVPTIGLYVAGVLAFAVLVVVTAARFWVARRRVALRAGVAADAAEDAAGTLQLALLVCLVGLTIYIQGKTHCFYHFIPLKWALALLGAALAGGFLPRRLRRLQRWWRPKPVLRAALVSAALVAGVSFYATYCRDFIGSDAPTPRSVFAKELSKALAPAETVVLFGFAPSVLYTLERRTPLPFVDSWIMYAGTPAESSFRQEFVRRWEHALADPSVRFFIVEPRLSLVPELRFDPKRSERADTVVNEHFPARTLRALGFVPSTKFGGDTGFTVYERLERAP